MRFLHTSDWHVGKTLKGRSRLDEQEEVLREVVTVARDRDVDAVLVAGDLYDSAAPTPQAQRIVVRTLADLARSGITVVAVAGNHDNAAALDAYRPVWTAADVTVLGRVRRPDDGGVLSFRARSTGEEVRVALLPWVSQRQAVSAADLVANLPADNSAGYDDKVRGMIAALSAGFDDRAVNVVVAHLTVVGGLLGGGERQAQSIFEYHVPASAFPADAHYVALGHLHRRQQLPAPAPVHYSGAPLAVDFGEQENTPVVCVVDASPGTPASVTDVPITTGRPLKTLRGTVEQLVSSAGEVDDAWLRVWVQEPSFPGMREEILAALPHALEVRLDPAFAPAGAGADRPGLESIGTRTPAELFSEYCRSRQVDPARLIGLFDRLHDDVSS
jgi:exonuclease SbcD